jgi:hypothetical protein
MKKLVLALFLVCPLLVVCTHGQDFVTNVNFNYPRTDKGIQLPAGVTFSQWQLVWSTNVPLAACTASACTGGSCSITVDTSPDGVTWTTGALFGLNCTLPCVTSAGVKGPQYAIAGGYVRINLSALTSATGGNGDTVPFLATPVGGEANVNEASVTLRQSTSGPRMLPENVRNTLRHTAFRRFRSVPPSQ